MTVYRHRAGRFHDFELKPVTEGWKLVAVIDPDGDEVERLLVAYYKTDSDFPTPQGIENFRTVLREFAQPTPPKPEEPKGIGAVIKTAGGMVYVATSAVGAGGAWRWRNPGAGYAAWGDLDVPDEDHILSRGIENPNGE